MDNSITFSSNLSAETLAAMRASEAPITLSSVEIEFDVNGRKASYSSTAPEHVIAQGSAAVVEYWSHEIRRQAEESENPGPLTHKVSWQMSEPGSNVMVTSVQV